jgi:tripeptidyl-peptidase-1
MFGTFKKLKSTIHSVSEIDAQVESQKQPPIVDLTTGVTVDASCNTTITVTCLKEIYNAVNYTPSAHVGNSVGITGYLEENANRADLQTFYVDQMPAAAAVNSTFKFISVVGMNGSISGDASFADASEGGLDSQNASEAGGEANLDVQFAFGVSFPVASTFYSTVSPVPLWPTL